jgi:hypothetical protein
MRPEPVNGGLWAYHHGCGRFLRRFWSASESPWDVEQSPTRASPASRLRYPHSVRFVRAPVCVFCSHSSTSSHPGIYYHHLPCHVAGTPRTPDQAQQITKPQLHQDSRRIKPPTEGPRLRMRPRILAANRQIDACSSLSLRSMRS